MIDSRPIPESAQAQSHRYIQEFPRFVCKNARRFYEISQLKGYVCKCRDPRCSIACSQNAAQKDAAIVARHLHDLPENMISYRGNLTLPPESGPESHRRVKKAFLRSLNRWKQRHGYTVEILARTHATDDRNAHYDILVYTDAPHKPFHRAMLDLWERSGGKQRKKNVRGATLVRLKDDEKDASVKYQQKAIDGLAPIVKEDFRATEPPPKLLNSRSISGLDLTWRTAGFWRSTTPDQIWSTLISEWFPQVDEDDLLARAMSRDANGNPPKPIRQREPEPLPVPYIAGNDPRRDRLVFAGEMPHDPDHAISINDYAKQWAVTGDYMHEVIRSIPGATCLQGRVNNTTRCHVYNAWYLNMIGRSSANLN